jgi:uncharacterized membrane protein HdeD (DUF308 family)
MSPDLAESYLDAVAARWWSPVIRGIAAILFGILSLAVPGASLGVLVLLWGVYAIVDGGVNIALAVQRGQAGGRWGWFLFEGLVSIAAGVLTFAWPQITAVVLLFVIAVWAIATGIAEVAAAITLRGVLGSEWLLGLGGVLSIAFGALLFARPAAGALAVVGAIGIYAIMFGALLVGLGVRLHRWHARRNGVPGGAATFG